MSQLDLIAARSWERTVFTTYALSLAFFEAVVLDALVRAGSQSALIFSDSCGVRAALSEQGARRVGRDYEVEPVSVQRGVFHPKITFLSAGDDHHLLVGSGNLTFGGWGMNLEVLEHLHPSFAADAFDDAADFFDYMTVGETVRHAASPQCGEIAERLRSAANGKAKSGRIRLFHSLDGAISTKLIEAAEGLGGATRLSVASPFWDGGAAVDGLCSGLGLGEVFIHAHGAGPVLGLPGTNWPARASTKVQAIRLLNLDDERRLHGKVMEVLCRHGRIVLSGSANATSAALGVGHNVEACIARIQRGTVVGWSYEISLPIELNLADDGHEETSGQVDGLLKAVLDGDSIRGTVVTPGLAGRGAVYQNRPTGPESLGEVDVAPDGSFEIAAPGLELRAWKGERLVLRVEAASGTAAEGFVSVSGISEITQRAGALAPRLLAILAGNETPADVAAMMSWFHEDPDRLVGIIEPSVGSGKGDMSSPGSPIVVPIAELNSSFARSHAWTGSTAGRAGGGWSRFMAQLLGSLREARGALGAPHSSVKDDEADDAEPVDTSNARQPDPAVEASMAHFELLLDLLLSEKGEPKSGMMAFDLAQYVCQRLRPEADRAYRWLERILDFLTSHGIPPARGEDVAGAAVLICGAAGGGGSARRTRLRLLRMRYDVGGRAPRIDEARGFQSVILQRADASSVWEEIQNVRTVQELVQFYVVAVRAGAPSSSYAGLEKLAPDEWPTLRDAFKSQKAQARVIVASQLITGCPRCHSALPTSELHKLRQLNVATALNCCNRVIVCEVL